MFRIVTKRFLDDQAEIIRVNQAKSSEAEQRLARVQQENFGLLQRAEYLSRDLNLLRIAVAEPDRLLRDRAERAERELRELKSQLIGWGLVGNR